MDLIGHNFDEFQLMVSPFSCTISGENQDHDSVAFAREIRPVTSLEIREVQKRYTDRDNLGRRISPNRRPNLSQGTCMRYVHCLSAVEELVNYGEINRDTASNLNLVAQSMRKLKIKTTLRGHPQGALLEAKSFTKLNESGPENSVSIKSASDLMSKHPDVPASLLLGENETHLSVKLVGFLLEEQLPVLDAQKIRDDVNQHEGSGTGDGSAGDFGEGHDDGNDFGVVEKHPEVDEVGGAAEDDEGTELHEDPFVREEGRLVDEVDELERDGEVG